MDYSFRQFLKGNLKTYKLKRFFNDSNDPAWVTGDDGREEAPLEESHVVSSERFYGRHIVVLDIDHAAWLIPSSNNHHLYVEIPPVAWEDYEEFLKAAAKIGLIEEGYAAVSIKRKHTAVRLPWVTKKEQTEHGIPATPNPPKWVTDPPENPFF